MKSLLNKFHQLLRWSEKYVKTDMVYLAKNSFWQYFSQIIGAFLGVTLSFAFAHLLSQESYGTYKYVLSIAGILASVSLSGLGSSALRSVSQGNEGTFIKSFFMNLRWSIFMIVAAGAISIYYFVMGNTIFGISFIIVGCTAPIIDSCELYAVLPSARRNFKWVSISSLLRATFATIGLITILVVTKNPLTIVFGYFILHTIATITIFIITYKHFKPNDKVDEESFKLAKHLSLLNILGSFADNIDQVLIYHFLGPIQVAIYSYTLVFPDNLQIINKNIGVLATPKYAVVDKEQAQKNLFSKSFKLFLFSVVIMLLYIAVAPIVFHYLFPQYLGSLVYSQVYSLSLIFSAVLPLALLDGQIAIRAKYKLNIISNVVKIVFIFGGIFYFGIWGAIIAKIISKAFGVSLGFYYAKKA